MMNELYLSEGRYVCPHCNGGRSNEKSFLVMNGWGKCFRASCTSRPERVRHGKLSGNQYSTEDRSNQPQLESAKFCRKFLGLSEKEIFDNRIQYCELDNRVYYPIYNDERDFLGYIKRGYDWLGGYTGSKSYNQISSDKTLIYFPHQPQHVSKCITLVEDALSAIKVSRHTKAAALIGTNLSRDDIAYLRSRGVRKVFIALDEDAQRLTVKLTRKLDLFFTATPLLIPRDPKDMSDKELKETFSEQ